MKQHLRILAGLPALCLLGAAHEAAAQTYPNKTIAISIATAAGSAPDAIIRAMAQKMTEAWKQPVIVENRATAGGITAVTTVTKSPPDGHTLLVHTAAFTIAPAMYKLPYDTFRDLLPVSIIAYVPNMLVAHPTLPVKNVKELIALANARAGDLNYASSGSGTPAHLAGELFKASVPIDQLKPWTTATPAERAELDRNHYALDKIVASRTQSGAVFYKCRWIGFGDDEDTWEPVANVPGPAIRNPGRPCVRVENQTGSSRSTAAFPAR